MIRIVCLLIGYVFGLFQTAYIIGKAHGFDIRDKGSGNSGTTNMLRTMGTRFGLLTFAGDCLKCMAAIFLVRKVFGPTHSDIMPLLVMYTGLGCILGHIYPFYLQFRGGKGMAVTAGLVFSMEPVLIIMGLIVFFGLFFLTHYVSLGSVMVYVMLMIAIPVMGQMGVYGMSQAHLIEMYVIVYIMAALILYAHRGNIQRLLSGTERKTYLTKKSDK